MKERFYIMAMIQLRDGRELKVKELVEELELNPGTLIEVTEVRRVFYVNSILLLII